MSEQSLFDLQTYVDKMRSTDVNPGHEEIADLATRWQLQIKNTIGGLNVAAATGMLSGTPEQIEELRTAMKKKISAFGVNEDSDWDVILDEVIQKLKQPRE